METSLKKWYERPYRSCQVNFTEVDPLLCDVAFFQKFWRDNHITCTVINAAGIVSYFPSQNPMVYRSSHLGNRDLFGEFIQAAKEEGLSTLARMDISKATEAFYQERPDCFARDIDGNPFKYLDRYLTCVNSPYYKEYIPGLLYSIATPSELK